MPRTILFVLLWPSTLLGQVGTQQIRTSLPADLVRDAVQLVSDTAIAADVRALESRGSRFALYNNRFTVAEWIRQRFADVGVADADTAGFVEWAYNTWQRNVIATIPGSSPGGEELIIGAHYDSRVPGAEFQLLYAPGADDNASGVAGIIEMARVLSLIEYRPRATIRFIAFAAEELGLLGSMDYANKAFSAGTNIVLMQNYDMIGYRDMSEADRNVAVNQYQAALAEADLMLELMQTYTSLTPHKTSANITRSDSYPFSQRLYKAIFIIEDENDFNPHYHSARDSSTYLDFTYAREIVQAGVAMTLAVDAQITGMSDRNEHAPGIWVLEQNHPNPFNPSTSIRYVIPSDGEARITVHNVLGETITTLVDRHHRAGAYSVRWVPDVPSGTYYYTLVAAPSDDSAVPRRMTRKMILLR